MRMLLSIVIPVFNVRPYIEHCLDSILCQDTHGVEIILVDDGSSDGSGLICDEYARRHADVITLHKENEGVSAARMDGVSRAKGEYVWFVDGDDSVTPAAMAEIMEAIATNPGIDVFVTPMFLSFDSGQKGYATYEIKEAYAVSGKDLLRDKDFFLIGPPHFIVRRKLFEDRWLTFPRGVRYEDEYYARVLKYRAHQCLILPHCLYVYRQWSGSHMHSVDMEGAEDILAVYNALDRFADEAVDKKDQGWFRNNIVSFLLEAYTRSERFFGTPEFASFYQRNKDFIRAEWKKYRNCFSLKDRMLAGILLRSPRMYSRLVWKYRAVQVALRNSR